jgi:circadian clock protein KaiC
VLNLRYFEAAGEVRQSIAVIKKRSGRHEKTIREFKLESGKGIRVGQPLKDFHGVLTGAPVFRGRAEQVMRGF